MNTENLLIGIHDRGLTVDERMTVEVIEQMKTDEACPNFRNVKRKKLKSQLNDLNGILN